MLAFQKLRITSFYLLFSVILAVGSFASAQGPNWKPCPPGTQLKVGDKVRVEFLGEWVEGTVVGFFGHAKWPEVKFVSKQFRSEMTHPFPTKRVQVPASTPEKPKPTPTEPSKSGESGGSGRRKPARARSKPAGNPFEPADRLRTWTDDTGQFKIEAEFVESSGSEVVLKKRDGSAVRVPLARLCKADRDYVASLGGNRSRKEIRPPHSPPAPVSVKTISPNWRGIKTLKLDRKVKPSGLEPDAGVDARFEAIRPIVLPAKEEHGERIRAVLSSWAVPTLVTLVSYCDSPDEKISRVFRYDLASKRPSVETVTIPDYSEPLDVGPKGELLLTRGTGSSDEEEMAVCLWKLEGGRLIPRLKCVPYDGTDKTFHKKVKWARLVDENHVLTANLGGKVVLWRLPDMRAIYKVEVQVGTLPVLSPGHRYMAVSTSDGLSVLDPKSGRLLGSYATTDYLGQPLFSPDGKQLAVVSSRRTQAWDFATGEMFRDISYTTPNWQPEPSLWPAPGYILLHGRYMLDIERHAVLWDYRANSRSSLRRASIGGKLWTVIRTDEERAFVPCEIPDARAEEVIGAIRPEDSLVLQPGMEIGLDVRVNGTPQEQKQVLDALRNQFRSNGFRIVDGAAIQLIARTEAGNRVKATYRGHGQVSFQKWTSRMELLIDDVCVWKQRRTTSSPAFLEVKDGETAEQAIRRHEKPSLSFFESIATPRYLSMPRNTITFGATELTPAGPRPAEPTPRKKPEKRPPAVRGNRA